MHLFGYPLSKRSWQVHDPISKEFFKSSIFFKQIFPYQISSLFLSSDWDSLELNSFGSSNLFPRENPPNIAPNPPTNLIDNLSGLFSAQPFVLATHHLITQALLFLSPLRGSLLTRLLTRKATRISLLCCLLLLNPFFLLDQGPLSKSLFLGQTFL